MPCYANHAMLCRRCFALLVYPMLPYALLCNLSIHIHTIHTYQASHSRHTLSCRHCNVFDMRFSLEIPYSDGGRVTASKLRRVSLVCYAATRTRAHARTHTTSHES